MEPKFEPGDRVVQKCGGPPMQVESLMGKYVSCLVLSEGVLRQKIFRTDELTLAEVPSESVTDRSSS